MSTRLAKRLQRISPSATVGITARAIRMRAQGRDIISLSAGEPDFDTPEHIKAAAITAIHQGQTKYTALDGAQDLKQAIVEKFRRDNALEYAPEQILVSSGAKQSCFNLCLALLDPGDEVVIPAPFWVSYPAMVRMAEAEPVIVQAAPENGHRMSPEQLAEAITPQTRLLILNSPCNPTGAVYTADDWRAFGEVLAEHPRINVLADDIYEHIYWAKSPFTSFAAACPEMQDRSITVNGMSKGYAMSGWRVGYAGGPRELIGAMTTVQGQSTTNACSISQAAATAALTGSQEPVVAMCRSFESRHTRLHELLNSLAGFDCLPGAGAFYLFPNIEGALGATGISDDVAFCEALLEDAGVALVPGTAFGAPGHLRISFAAAPETLEQAADRIDHFLKRRRTAH